jgi:hypothetical protein
MCKCGCSSYSNQRRARSRRFANGSWQIERIAGREFFFLPSGAPHEIRWDLETDLIDLDYEPAFLCELPTENVAAVLADNTLPDAMDDPVKASFASSFAAGMLPRSQVVQLNLVVRNERCQHPWQRRRRVPSLPRSLP